LELARIDFWEFCVLLAGAFYTPDKPHLQRLCSVLQALYEGRIIRTEEVQSWQIVDQLPEDGNYEMCRRLMTNIPPQHGKTRTLVNFCKWALGRNQQERIITCSYNDNAASDFSRYTRDGIAEEKNDPAQIVYSDIFPGTRLKAGNASFEKWALEGQHFSYIGAGIEGSITGKGATILIVDDPIKDVETAYNEAQLEKIWTWYSNTFISRVSAAGGEPLEIVNMTRWSKKDICGRILTGPEASTWYEVIMQAYDEDADGMLCPALLSKKRYLSLQTNMDPAIFRANYHQEPVDVQGQLYQGLKEYEPKDLPEKFEKIISYTDTADEGDDWLCSGVAGVSQGELFLLDVYFTPEAMEKTEPEEAEFLVRNKVTRAKFESNNGGRGFARNVQRLLWEKHHTRMPHIEWFSQTQNKISRILTHSSFIINHVFFPKGWSYKHPKFYNAIMSFQKEGGNKHDDGPDMLTGLCEMVERPSEMHVRAIGDMPKPAAGPDVNIAGTLPDDQVQERCEEIMSENLRRFLAEDD